MENNRKDWGIRQARERCLTILTQQPRLVASTPQDAMRRSKDDIRVDTIEVIRAS